MTLDEPEGTAAPRSAERERWFMRQVAAIFSTDLPLDQVYERLCEAIADFIDASVVFIALAQRDGSVKMEYLHDHGTMRRAPDLRMPKGSPTERVYSGAQTIVYARPEDWGPTKFDIDSSDPRTNDSVSAMFVPVRQRDRVYGVLSIQSAATGAYSGDDVRLMEAVGRYIAVAIRNQRVAGIPASARVRPLISVAIIALAVIVSAALWSFYSLRAASIAQGARDAQMERARPTADILDASLVAASQVAHSAAAIFERAAHNRAAAEETLRSFLDSAPRETVYGAGVWFRPFAFTPAVQYFGPYVHRDRRGGPNVLTYEWSTPGYDYPSRPWFRSGISAEGEADYTDPYFDTDLVYVTIAQSFPAGNSPAGVVTVDFVVPQLARIIPRPAQPGELMYVTTRSGAPFVFPEEAALLADARAHGAAAKTIADVTPEELRAFIARNHPGARTTADIPVKYTGWNVYISSEDRYLYADVTVLRSEVLFAAVALWIVAGAILFGLRARRLTSKRTMRLEIEKVELETEIEERQRAEEQLRRVAFVDALTGLPNRAYMVDQLRYAIARRRTNRKFSFAVLFLDLDRFHVVNDSLGHSIGDKLLIAVGSRLEECLHANDIVARIGGDEFVILLQDLAGTLDARRVATEIERKLRDVFTIGPNDLFITGSIGIAIGEDYDAPGDLLRDADIAMYRAKANAIVRYAVFDREMHAMSVDRMRMETDLRKAIEGEQFALHYQPIIELASGRLCGFEALLRWTHPERGMLPPSQFIPVAEQTRLIVPLGRWVMETACRQLADWKGLGLSLDDFAMSVNISAVQYAQMDLIMTVREALAASVLPGSALKLEITESAIMHDPAATVKALEELRAIGVHAVVDDFGTGYSSLSYLQQFPLDALKIDQSFVGRMLRNQDSLEIVKAIVTLAKSLRLKLTAEGIESEEQLSALRALGVEHGQGYFISRPVPADRALALLGAQNSLLSSSSSAR